MKLDLSCPIEVRGYSLNPDDRGATATVRLYNLSARRVASFEAVAKWRSSTADRSVATPFLAERLRAGGENGFTIDLSTDRLPGADSLDLLFTRVCFEDGAPDWRVGDGPFAELTPLPAMDSESLSILRDAAGSDAMCYPEQSSQTWRCVCGRLNANTTDRCARCHRDHLTAIGYTPQSVRQRIMQTDSPIDDSAELSALHTQYLRQRKRLLRRTLLAAAAVLALTVCLILFSEPAHPSTVASSAAEITASDD